MYPDHEKVRTGRCFTCSSIALVALASLCASAHAGGRSATPVHVIVDMDPSAPGMQSSVSLEAHPLVTHDVAVWIFDPLGTRTMYSIGYIGGINRGIAFGHTPTWATQGEVTAMTGVVGAPVHPDNWCEVIPTAWTDPAFDGPEVQYVEFGATAPATIAASPPAPVFIATITIENAVPGDEFPFYLLDFPAVWAPEGGGAFSTQSEWVTLDTGGDSVPDGTVCAYGIDPDTPVPMPPAAFLVNYIDGGGSGGGAVVAMRKAVGDINADGAVDVLDLMELLAAWGPCPRPNPPDPTDCPADLNGDDVVDVLDLLLLLGNWS